MVYGQLGIAALWGFFIASSLLLFPVWLVRRLRGKITPGAAIRIRLWPLLALHGGHGVARNPGALFLKFWRHWADDLGLISGNQDFQRNSSTGILQVRIMAVVVEPIIRLRMCECP